MIVLLMFSLNAVFAQQTDTIQPQKNPAAKPEQVVQSDSIFLHCGKLLNVNIAKVDQYVIVYKYLNEDAENVISKNAVEKIVFWKSGRVEQCSKKIVLASPEDWEKVQIVYEKQQTVGLVETVEVKGKTAFINYHTGATADAKAEERVKRAAAALGCPFVFITSDKTSNYAGEYGTAGLGSKQSVKKGIGFRYE
jgi:sRNA-binding regulator protein Hfq